ncbi:3-hydroxyacyl-CoA dehydrogenase NAD-binding domain-containing protein [Streptomyces albidoflavus]|uniref:3-hydroxyacyl-CoA dehydrogenase NAD-binding domain-containing protein n=2 Tax=Streptomyces albidoflavus TaxID=1886 RepID=UPI0034A5065C
MIRCGGHGRSGSSRASTVHRRLRPCERTARMVPTSGGTTDSNSPQPTTTRRSVHPRQSSPVCQRGQVRPAARRARASHSGEAVEHGVYTLTNDTAALSSADLVIEAVSEDLEVKSQVLRRLNSVCPDRAVLVSVTASLPLKRLAIASGRPGRTLGLRCCVPCLPVQPPRRSPPL